MHLIRYTTSGVKFFVTLCNNVRIGLAYNYMATSRRSSAQVLNAI